VSALRVLLTTDTVGGVWQYATDLARALVPHGIEPVLAVLGPAPSPDQRRAANGLRLVETGLPLDWLAESPDDVIDAGRALAALAGRERVDLVQLNAPALAVGGEFPVPVVAVAHSCLLTWWEAVVGGTPPDDFRWRAGLHAGGLRKADLVVTPSAAFAQATRQAYALDRSPTVVHNGRAPMPLPEAGPGDFAFTAGRLWDRGKDVATLDRAAALLRVPLHAAGPLAGPDGETVGLHHARAVGVLREDELAARLAARPIFVSAALYEPFGLAVLEAAQAGCPLVLSDIPTFRELWDGAATFVSPRDASGFAAAITRFSEDAAARAHWGGRARERSARYTVETMAAEMVTAYRGLLGEGARAAA
jgi:glycosyltransferase involved in cell wall biosynthesis